VCEISLVCEIAYVKMVQGVCEDGVRKFKSDHRTPKSKLLTSRHFPEKSQVRIQCFLPSSVTNFSNDATLRFSCPTIGRKKELFLRFFFEFFFFFEIPQQQEGAQ